MSEIKGIFLGSFHAPVQYVENKYYLIKEGQLTPYNDIPAEFRSIFTKQTSYAKQREYQFVFWFVYYRYGLLSVRADPVVIPILPIADIRENPEK